MHEHAEPRVAKPFHPRVVLFGSFVRKGLAPGVGASRSAKTETDKKEQRRQPLEAEEKTCHMDVIREKKEGGHCKSSQPQKW